MLGFITRQILWSKAIGGGPPPVFPVTINVPSGSSHDFWLFDRSGVTWDQAQADTDFDLATEFTVPPVANTAHGMILGDVDLTTTGQFLRFDVYNPGAGPTLFAANDAGVVYHNSALPVGHTHLRMERSGNNFNVYSSPDGTAWTLATAITYTLTVATISLWAGNFGTNPAHSATFNYLGAP